VDDPRRGLGRRTEEAAAAFLAAQGLTVVARNVRLTEGEIDLVCRDGDTWVFVEVKSRHAEWGDAAAAVTRDKQRRLARLARHYLKWKRLGSTTCRFDVVAVTVAPDGGVFAIRHLRDAFEGGAW
jgi:putative endonuclease